MSTSPGSAHPTIPASPGGSFAWAGVWAVVAALGAVVLARNWQQALSFDMGGQRTEGIVLFTPFIAIAISVILVVRGLRAVGRRRAYRERWSAPERARLERESLAGQPSTPFFVVAAVAGVLWLSGSIVVLLFLPQMLPRPGGLLLALELLILLAMAWVSALAAGLRRRAANSGATA